MISDKYVAVFELVKNSYDAGATKVQIIFANVGSYNERIIVADNGCGMTAEDLSEKFLFVAYSEKKTSNKDQIEDYRRRLKRNFSGAKGVGRFSCDRLGETLTLETCVEHEKIKHQLVINWNDFESDDKKDFISVDVAYEILKKKDGEISGTNLIITNLREKWNRDDFLTLKKYLMKLSSPMTDQSDFEIELIVPTEKKKDDEIRLVEKSDFSYNVVNGIIINDILKKVNMKTTNISVHISNDGDEIRTSLHDRGMFIFSFREKNIKYKELKNIEFSISYLNRTAKLNFTKQMGIEPVNYGSIFVYKNEIRIYPYGEPGTDFFGIDLRKAQGYKRFFGTRELLGYIRIMGDAEYFYETTSRSGGFVRTIAVDELEDFFQNKVLRILEKYVVEGIDWTERQSDDNKTVEINPKEVKEKIIDQFSALISNKHLISAEINPALTTISSLKDDTDVDKTIRLLKRAGKNSQNMEITEIIQSLEKQFSSLKSEKESAESAYESTYEKFRQAEKEIDTRIKQTELLQSDIDKDVDFLIDGYHRIAKNAEVIKSNLLNLMSAEEDLTKKQILNTIFNINHQVKIIAEMCIYGTHKSAGDDPYNIFDFLKDVISKNTIHSSYINRLNISVNSTAQEVYTDFSMYDLAAIIDNITSNSIKAHAKSLTINIDMNDEYIIIDFIDDGVGLSKDVVNPEDIFERNYSKTGGTGLGLAHIKKLLDDNNLGYVKYVPTDMGFHLQVGIKDEL